MRFEYVAILLSSPLLVDLLLTFVFVVLVALLAVAVAVGKELNMYSDGDFTHYKQRLEQGSHMRQLYSQFRQTTQFDERKKQVAEFNAQNRWKKRGIALIPTKFGMSFTLGFLNQAGALVHIYTDGTVAVSHGGVEMGQGLHTKMAQVAANALGVDIEKVHILETATDKVSNTSPSAASVQADINGMAVLRACEQLNERLAPLKAQLPNASFAELANKVFTSHSRTHSLSLTSNNNARPTCSA